VERILTAWFAEVLEVLVIAAPKASSRHRLIHLLLVVALLVIVVRLVAWRSPA